MLDRAPSGEARSAPSAPDGRDLAALALALALTFAAGMADGAGFLGFGGVFISFMSGNTTRLGVGLAQGAWPVAVLLASVVALFVVGAAAGRALALVGGAWRRGAVLLLTGLLLLMAAAVGAREWTAAALILCAPAMGVMNAAITRADGVPVTPNYVTGTLGRLGAALADWALGGEGRPVAVLSSMWAGLLAGSIAGAWAFGRLALAAFAVPAAIILLLAGLTVLVPALRPSRSEP